LKLTREIEAENTKKELEITERRKLKMSQVGGPPLTSIKDLKPGMNSLHLSFIVLDIGLPSTTKENQEVRTVKVADKSGMVNLSVWNELGKALQSGDIIRMSRGYTGMFKNCLTVYTTRAGDFHKIGDFCMIFSETPYMSDPNPEMAHAFERSEVERKAEFAARKGGNFAAAGNGKNGVQGNAAGRSGINGNPPGNNTPNKPWGTNTLAKGATKSNGGNDRNSLGNANRVPLGQRGNSKEKR